MIKYVGLGLKRDKACSIAGLTRHQFYHKPTGGKRGRRPTEFTFKVSDTGVIAIENSVVVNQIKEVHKDPDLRSGYKRMCAMLMLFGYIINKKKVQRLMAENDLLNPSVKQIGRNFARYRIVTPEGPLAVIEMDIKHIWVDSERRSAYILTAIDTFTRVVLNWQVGFTMKSNQVENMWEEIIENHLEPHGMRFKPISIEVRNDNGPQFKSCIIQQFFKDNYLNQVFTHPYTPQENGHIESFHKILSNALEPSYWSLTELETRLNRFYEAYNTLRVHGSIANLPPVMFWKLWNMKLVERKLLPNKKVRFILKCCVQDIPGIISLREHLAIKTGAKHTDVIKNGGMEINHAAIMNTPVYQSPSVTSCTSN